MNFVFVPKTGKPQLWETIPVNLGDGNIERIQNLVRIIDEPLEVFLKAHPGIPVELIAEVIK